ncbi:MAG: MBL fold metallo-hydrolase, partial [Thermoplasmata archaeon]
HAGDTAIFSDMEIIGKYFRPDVAMLPIGGHYTMDQNDAIIAMKMLRARTAIPMHYNTFDLIKADAEKFRKDCSDQGIKTIIPEIEKEFSI